MIYNDNFETPILLIVFNRLDTTIQVFEKIKKLKPQKLYISSDGGRNKIEINEVEKIRDYCLKSINWKCEVKTKYNTSNLGCKIAVSSAITWLFSHESRGIILEDDCVPSMGFFNFCQELLIKYEFDKRIWHIGGYKHPKLEKDNYSYNFSKYTMVWGWATWADRWKSYDIELNEYKSNPKLIDDYSFFDNRLVNLDRKHILNLLLSEKLNTWDYQWNYTVRINNGLAIRPSENLIQNIGFQNNPTHDFKNQNDLMMNNTSKLNFPLKHPENIMIYRLNDIIFENSYVIKNKFKILKDVIYDKFKA